MTKYKVETKAVQRIEQGDIYRNIEYIENIDINNDDVTISKILYPYIVVLSQDCDLQQNAAYFKTVDAPKDQDKQLMSVIIAPLYNEELFLNGEHLADDSIKFKMQKITKEKKGDLTTQYRNLINNETPRYHFLSFEDDAELPNMIIDFKHFFTININYLEKMRTTNFVKKIQPLYRELLTQRFAAFLSRIGLP